MRKTQLKGGKAKMKKTDIIIVLGTVLILTLGTFASLGNAAMLTVSNIDATEHRTDRADVTAHGSTHGSSDDSTQTTNARNVVTEEGELTTISESGETVTQSGEIVENKRYNARPVETTKTSQPQNRRDSDEVEFDDAREVKHFAERTENRAKRSSDTVEDDEMVEEPTESKLGKKGDINNDGLINFGDINWFTMVYYNQWFFKDHHPELFWRTDINNDGLINQVDIDLFVTLLTQ